MSESPPSAPRDVVVWRDRVARLEFRPDDEARNAVPLWPASAPDDQGPTSRSLAHDVASRVSDAVDATVEPLLAAIADAVTDAVAAALGPQAEGAAAQLDVLAALVDPASRWDDQARGLVEAAAVIGDLVWHPTGEAATLALFDALVSAEPQISVDGASWARRAQDGLLVGAFAEVAGIGESDVVSVLDVAAQAVMEWLATHPHPEIVRHRDRWARVLVATPDRLQVELIRPTVVVEPQGERSVIVAFAPGEARIEPGALVFDLALGDRTESVVLPVEGAGRDDVEVDGSALRARIRVDEMATSAEGVVQEIGGAWLRFDPLVARADTGAGVGQPEVAASLPVEEVDGRFRSVALGTFFADWQEAVTVVQRIGAVGATVVSACADAALSMSCEIVVSVPVSVSTSSVVDAARGEGRSEILVLPSRQPEQVAVEVMIHGMGHPRMLRAVCGELAVLGAVIVGWTVRSTAGALFEPIDVYGIRPPSVRRRPDVALHALLDAATSFAEVRTKLDRIQGGDVSVHERGDEPVAPPFGWEWDAHVLTLTGAAGWKGALPVVDRIADAGLDIVASSMRARPDRWAGSFAVRPVQPHHLDATVVVAGVSAGLKMSREAEVLAWRRPHFGAQGTMTHVLPGWGVAEAIAGESAGLA